jgi:hypothetical protein
LRSKTTHNSELPINTSPWAIREGTRPSKTNNPVMTPPTPKKNMKKPVGRRSSATIRTMPRMSQVHHVKIRGSMAILESNVPRKQSLFLRRTRIG